MGNRGFMSWDHERRPPTRSLITKLRSIRTFLRASAAIWEWILVVSGNYQMISAIQTKRFVDWMGECTCSKSQMHHTHCQVIRATQRQGDRGTKRKGMCHEPNKKNIHGRQVVEQMAYWVKWVMVQIYKSLIKVTKGIEDGGDKRNSSTDYDTKRQ